MVSDVPLNIPETCAQAKKPSRHGVAGILRGWFVPGQFKVKEISQVP